MTFVDCPVCRGAGELCELLNPPDPQTEVSARCPVCDGDGCLSHHPDGSCPCAPCVTARELETL